MKNKTSIFKLSDDKIDSLIRFIKSNNPVSCVFNMLLNAFWALGKGIKILLKKDKIEVAVEEAKEPIVQVNNVFLEDVLKVLDFSNNKDNTLLYIDLKKENSDISGALDYSNSKKKELCNEGYKVIELSYIRFTNNWIININESNDIYLKDFMDTEKLFKYFSIKKLYINNLVYNTSPEQIIDSICEIKKKYDFEIEYALHDYLPLCPSYFLLNKQGLPCDIVNDETCNECLYNNPYRTVIRNDIKKYRESFLKLFNNCSRIEVFSNFSKEKLLEVYNSVENKIVVIPHKPLMNDNFSKYIPRKKQEEINIGFVGNFHHIKGADFYIEVINKLKENGYKVNPVVIGYKQNDEYQDIDYKFTGPYRRNELGKILTENKIDFVIYPSINSETYSYIVQELMMLNVPIVLFKRGAPSERIIEQNYNMAEIADDVSLESLYSATVRMIDKL